MSTKSAKENTIKTIFKCDLIKKPQNVYCLTVTGSGFLYNMVRIMAGTIIECGLNKKNFENVKNIIKSLDRKNAGQTAPANGLCLTHVDY